MAKSNSGQTVLVGVCAGIAAYTACDMISMLRKNNLRVVVCMSKNARHFVTALTLETLSANRVYKDMWADKQDYDPAHISLAKQADLILIMPATADIIAKVAHGICDDLLSSTITACNAPVLFAPAMNEAMYKNKILQANINTLKNLGYSFVGPVEGHLACGDMGIGHIADTEDILMSVKKLLA
jgi:phosphopantothenoylcysteine decarboxylase / phosphopantothenate---cysteine ligase